MRPLLPLLLLTLPVSAARVYYVNQTELQAGQILSMKPDGTGHTTIWSATQVTDLRGIAVDAAAGRLYFAHSNQNAGTLALTDVALKTLPVTGGTPATLVSFPDNTFLADVEWEPSDNWVYVAVPTTLQLHRCRPNGSEFSTILTHTASGQGPYFVEIDPVAQRAYWGLVTNPGETNTNFARGSLATGTVDSAWFLTTPSRTRDLALDNTAPGGRLYWCDRQNGAVYARAPEGGAIQTIITGLNAPHGLAIDPEAGYAYAADTGKRGSGSQTSAHDVVRFKMDGSGGLEVLSLFNSVAEPYDLDIDLTSVSYADWRTRFFVSTAPNASVATDADADGLSNGAEYAFFTHPLRADLPGANLQPHGTGIRYARRRVTDIPLRVEVSTDLTTWHWNNDTPGAVWTVEQSTTPRDIDSEWVTAQTAPAVAGASRIYYRLRAMVP